MKLTNTKKLLLLLLTIIATLCLVFGLSACNFGNNGNQTGDDDEGNQQVDGDNTNDGPGDSGDNNQPKELTPSEGLEYTLSEDGTYYILSGIGTCTDTAIVIPSEYNNIAVTEIGDFIFFDRISSLSLATFKDIIIPDSITIIGIGAFYECSNLENLTLPVSITSIGDYAFYGCSSLTNVYITDLTAWCNIDFENYSSNPLYNAGNLYLNGKLVEDLVIPDDVTAIKNYAFLNCSSLTRLTIGNNVQTIGDYAFCGHRKLYELVIPDSVKTIGAYAFSVSYDMEAYLKSIYYNLLSLVTIGKNVESIGQSAFWHCENIIEVNNLSSLDIVAGSDDNGGVAKYAKNVYTSTSGASNLITEGDFVFYNDNGSYSLIRYTGNNVMLTLPDLTINGEKVSYEINSRAFYYNYNIKSLTIPDNVSSIGSSVFGNCHIVEICNLSSLELTAGSLNNGKVAYYAKNIYNATSGESHLITQGDYIFYNDNGAYYLVAYTGEETALTLPELTINGKNVNYEINEGTFYYNAKIESVIIPDCVTAIGDGAFFWCTSLTDITIGECVTTIGDEAFEVCTSLTNIKIGDGVTSIGAYAFFSCASLTSIVIPDSVTSIGNGAFRACSSLTSLVIPDNVTSIGMQAFSACSSLTSITIPDNVTSIGNSAFSACSSLTSITIPDNVTSIGNSDFN